MLAVGAELQRPRRKHIQYRVYERYRLGQNGYGCRHLVAKKTARELDLLAQTGGFGAGGMNKSSSSPGLR